MTKLIMHGCNGKMGQVISKIVKEDPNVEMAAGIDAYTGIANDYPVFESIEKCDIKADAIVDFSTGCLTTVWKNRFRLYCALQGYQRSS